MRSAFSYSITSGVYSSMGVLLEYEKPFVLASAICCEEWFLFFSEYFLLKLDFSLS
jgi:hypothetical protein